jgi:hypothetical protein
MFKEMFQSSDTSPIYQLKNIILEIYEKVMLRDKWMQYF